MTTANAAHASFVNFKLGFLEKQLGNLHDLSEDANKVLRDARAWLEGRDVRGMCFEDICREIDDIMLFLAAKEIGTASDHGVFRRRASSEEIIVTDGEAVSVEPEQRSAEKETSTGDFTWFQSDFREMRYGSSPAYYMSKVMSRLDALEASYSSLQTGTQNTDSLLGKVEARVAEISQAQSEALEQQKETLIALESKLKSSKQDKKKFKALVAEVEWMKQQQKTFLANVEDTQEIVHLTSHLKSRGDGLSAENKNLDAAVKGSLSKNKYESLVARLEETQKIVEAMKFDLKSRIGDISAKLEATEGEVKELLVRSETAGTAIQDLAVETNENKSLLDTLLTFRDEEQQKHKTLDARIKAIIKKLNKNQKDGKDKLEEINGGYKMVCSMVANRLLPLERLRTILNQKVKTREENETKLGTISEKVAVLMGKMTDMETRISKRVGFTAAFPAGLTPLPEKGMIIRYFTRVCCNQCDHFNPSSGTFTAPVDGIYVVSLTLYQWEDGAVNVNVNSRRRNLEEKDPCVRWVCSAGTKMANTSGNGLGVVLMQAGDHLYVNVVRKEGNVSLTGYSSWSCFLVC